MVDMISEYSDQNVQLRRLTKSLLVKQDVLVNPEIIGVVKALIRLLICRLIILIVQVFLGFVMHTHMGIVCANLNA